MIIAHEHDHESVVLSQALEYLRMAKAIVENLTKGRPAFPSADPGAVKLCKLQQGFMYRLTGEVCPKCKYNWSWQN